MGKGRGPVIVLTSHCDCRDYGEYQEHHMVAIVDDEGIRYAATDSSNVPRLIDKCVGLFGEKLRAWLRRNE